MAKIAGHEITKNTFVGMSIGTLVTVIAVLWAASDIGRPLFAADLERIEKKIDTYQTSTTIQILSIRKAALNSELREAKRDLRRNPSDDDAVEDIDEIESDIDDLQDRINCHRTKGCRVEADI